MGDGENTDDSAENLSTVGSGRVDSLFDEIESTIDQLDEYADELATIRRRIDRNEGATSGHVRNRVTVDADTFVDDVTAATERLRDELQALKRTVE